MCTQEYQNLIFSVENGEHYVHVMNINQPIMSLNLSNPYNLIDLNINGIEASYILDHTRIRTLKKKHTLIPVKYLVLNDKQLHLM